MGDDSSKAADSPADSPGLKCGARSAGMLFGSSAGSVPSRLICVHNQQSRIDCKTFCIADADLKGYRQEFALDGLINIQ